MIEVFKNDIQYKAGKLIHYGNDFGACDEDDMELNTYIEILRTDGLNGYKLSSGYIGQDGGHYATLMKEGIVVSTICDGCYLIASHDLKEFMGRTGDELEAEFSIKTNTYLFKLLLWIENIKSKRRNIDMIRRFNNQDTTV